MRFKYQQLFGNLVSGVLTTSRKWSLPDRDGTIAITSDVTQPNILINGNFGIAQRATTGTITAGTAVPTASLGYQVADNWFGYSIGGNPTVAQAVGFGGSLNRYQITGAAGVTSIGIGQRIESVNAAQLAGKAVTLSVELSNSVFGVVTWTASYPTTTADTFGTIGTPTKTTLATGTFTVTSSLNRYVASFTCSDPHVRRGLEIVFTVGALTSGTWLIGNAKIEVGSIATAFVNPDFTGELLKCQRLLQIYKQPKMIGVGNGLGISRMGLNLLCRTRVSPIVSATGLLTVYNGPSEGTVQLSTGILTTFANEGLIEFNMSPTTGTFAPGTCVISYLDAPNTSMFTISAQIP